MLIIPLRPPPLFLPYLSVLDMFWVSCSSVCSHSLPIYHPLMNFLFMGVYITPYLFFYSFLTPFPFSLFVSFSQASLFSHTLFLPIYHFALISFLYYTAHNLRLSSPLFFLFTFCYFLLHFPFFSQYLFAFSGDFHFRFGLHACVSPLNALSLLMKRTNGEAEALVGLQWSWNASYFPESPLVWHKRHPTLQDGHRSRV